MNHFQGTFSGPHHVGALGAQLFYSAFVLGQLFAIRQNLCRIDRQLAFLGVEGQLFQGYSNGASYTAIGNLGIVGLRKIRALDKLLKSSARD